MSEIRYDPLFDTYTIIAPERLHRPMPHRPAELASDTPCPFCPGNEHLTPHEIFALRDGKRWRTRVVPNLYKALQIEAPRESRREGLYERWSGYGAHEIVIDTPQHDATLSTMQIEQIVAWLATLQERIRDLSKDPNLASIAIFKNSGLLAGATQPHPHTQIIASMLLPKHLLRLGEHLWHYYEEHGRALMDDIIASEKQNDRFLYETHSFCAFAPFASAFAFESIVAAKECRTLAACSQAQLQELASHLQKLMYALTQELGEFSYNLLLYEPPLRKNFQNEHYYEDLPRFYRFFVRITPRIYTLAGFELLSHEIINPVAPELAASLLRRHYAPGS